MNSTYKFPKFHPAQLEVYEDTTRFKVLAAGRRWGKTRLGIVTSLEVALRGGRAWWIAPTYGIATVGWRAVMQAVMQIPDVAYSQGDFIREQDRMRLGDRIVTLPGGGSIAIKSGDNPQRLRGEGLDYVVMDEAAFLREELWSQVIRPALTERQGKALFISTPNGHNWFHELYLRAQERKGWKAFHYPTASNPFIPADELEQAKEEIGSLLFAQEYKAEFLEAGEGIIKPEWFRYFKQDGNIIDCGDYKFNLDECIRFATVDLAASVKETADYTVICSVAIDKKNNLFVLDIIRQRLEGPDIIPAIKQSMLKNNLQWVSIEKVNFQLALVQMARREGLPVRELYPDKDKVARAMPLTARLEGGNVYFRAEADWLPDFQRELLQFPAGQHDDQVDALAYAVLETQVKKKWTAY